MNKNLIIKESELEFSFVRSSGPGGQNVNKVATAVQLRFNIPETRSINEVTKERLKHIAGKKVTSEGILIIEAKRFRTQEKNRQDAISRLAELINKASRKLKKRIKTKPSSVSKAKRIDDKKKQGEKKKMRVYRGKGE